MIEQGLVAYLAAQTGVTNLVGSRIYPQRAPQLTGTAQTQAANYPLVVFNRISTNRPFHLKAALGMPRARIQLDVYGLREADVRNVAEQLRQVLDGFQGTMGAFTVNVCRLENDRDSYQPPLHDDEIGLYGVGLDVVLTYQETVTITL